MNGWCLLVYRINLELKPPEVYNMLKMEIHSGNISFQFIKGFFCQMSFASHSWMNEHNHLFIKEYINSPASELQFPQHHFGRLPAVVTVETTLWWAWFQLIQAEGKTNKRSPGIPEQLFVLWWRLNLPHSVLFSPGEPSLFSHHLQRRTRSVLKLCNVSKLILNSLLDWRD